MRLLRLIKIIRITLRFGLDELFLSHARLKWLRRLVRFSLFWRDLREPRGARLRRALESLGPIFVKFGQVLSTRRDLLPTDIADELAKLQDQVPPFTSAQAIATLERVYGRSISEVFLEFNPQPTASASVAQVHFAKLPDGTEVAIKVLRPNIEAIIEKDLALMHIGAGLVEAIWEDGRRLRAHDVVSEFEKHLFDELDLIQEAANASQLRRNFADSGLLRVPEVYWDYCHREVMVMQRMYGRPISQVAALRESGVDIPKLAQAGVEIFFTQVFRDAFFHADMHPGNIFVNDQGQYIALDFGIMGTLTERDKNYLAMNFLAFFKRDYRGVAQAHIDAGWVPSDTRVDEFESAMRAVCEPVFDRPLKEISYGKLLLRLFQISRRFNVRIQPQLVLLQKTLLNVEGLGRDLDPDLDLWKTAKPFLERWMSEQIGWRGFLATLKEEAPAWGNLFPKLPRLVYQALHEAKPPEQELILMQLVQTQRKQKRLLVILVWLIILLACGEFVQWFI